MKAKLLCASLLAALVSGCAGMREPPAPPPIVPPAKPQACLTLDPLPACRLPDWYDKATPEDQAALELNCLAVIAESQRNERTLRACLVGWIEKRDRTPER